MKLKEILNADTYQEIIYEVLIFYLTLYINRVICGLFVTETGKVVDN